MRQGFSQARAPIEIVRDASMRAGGYRLNISPESIEIHSADVAGERSALTTLGQLERQYKRLRCLDLED